jgi:V8-like Glu-specific endopeptidase
MTTKNLATTALFLASSLSGTTLCLAQVRIPQIEGLRKMRMEDFEAKLEKTVPQGSRNRAVLGNVVETAEGAAISADRGPIVKVANPEILKNAPKDIPIEFIVTRAEDAVRVEGFNLQVVSNWKKTSNRLAVNRFEELHRSFGELEETVNRLLPMGAMGADTPELQKAVANASEAAVKAFQTVPASDHATREVICERFAELRDLRLKARFGRDDNYWPEVYQKIYGNSRSAVAVARKGQPEPFGSGVMIGDSLVLTCLHVAQTHPISQVEVWFDFETTSQGQQPKATFPVRQIVYSGQQEGLAAKPYDFALIELGPNVHGELAHTKFPKTVLSADQTARDDAIYVVGNPSGRPRMVHDNAFVLFPYHVSKDGMTELQMIVCHEIHESPNTEDELKEFLDSYVPLTEAEDEFAQFSRRWSQLPVIAADCDTSHGNSGSGAWDRSTNRLIGILFAGEYDLGPEESYTPGWRRHEAILPISAIVDQLDRQKPAWRTDYQVVIQ